jgi:hypothetical protein
MVQYRALRAARRAKLAENGVHILRHSFCSHLAMRGAPIEAIQGLGGNRDLGMTERYMHLRAAALDRAMRLLEQLPAVKSFGDISNDGGRVKRHPFRSGRRSRLSLAKSRRRRPYVSRSAWSMSTSQRSKSSRHQ